MSGGRAFQAYEQGQWPRSGVNGGPCDWEGWPETSTEA